MMDKKYLDPLKELDFANLSKAQEERLRDFENKFNNEFGLDYYFMVMKKE
jgi:hypothetical protein